MPGGRRALRTETLVRCILVSWLSDSEDLALFYMMSALTSKRRRSPLTGQSLASEASDVLEKVLDSDAFLLAAVRELLIPESKIRDQADVFVMESLLVQHVVEQAQLGITMSLGSVIDKWLSMWHSRTTAPAEHKLVRLTHHRGARRNFGRHLRTTWMLKIGVMPVAKPLSDHVEIAFRVP